MKKTLLVACMLCLGSTLALAKEIKKVSRPAEPAAVSYADDAKTGIGFTHLSSNLTDLCVRRWFSDKMGVEGIFGFNMNDNDKYFDLGGKFLAVISKRQNCTFYGVGGLGIENSSIKQYNDTNKDDTALIIGVGVGSEWFLPSLPELGFSFEVGVGYNSVTKTFATVGGWVPEVGMRYYF